MSNGREESYVRWLSDLTNQDVPQVGGKNASLGEMVRTLQDRGVRVPPGFATTAQAYRRFLEANGLEEPIKERLAQLREDWGNLDQVGRRVRELFTGAEWPREVAEEMRSAYQELNQRLEAQEMDVAVRSSATAEDLPEASFAGQQETFLNVSGEEELLDACRRCYASLFTDRAISYREEHGFDHLQVALSVGVQKMVRADRAGAGVMFTLDTDSGFPDVVVINAAWGLGENVVQGTVTPDEYVVFKPLLGDESKVPIVGKELGAKEKKMVYATGGSRTTKNTDTPARQRARYVLSDAEILRLARWAAAIEEHYGRPMDIEWAKDGEGGELFIVQARPETVQSQKEATSLKTYTLQEKGERLVKGLAIGDAVAAGKAVKISDPDQGDRLEKGDILVAEMTDPDWVPLMKRAAGIVTDHGGRTAHAAIVSRELGIPAVVGAGDATERLETGREITISCAEGEYGFVYAGKLDYESREVSLDDLPSTDTGLMMNIASPPAAFRWWRLPARGIGLARMEFIINNVIKIHPLALVHYDELQDKKVRRRIEGLTRGYQDKTEYFVDHLARGIGRIAASQHPHPVILRMSDFKTNEYADLIGGAGFEPRESNPMLGFRGASRYYSDRYRRGFALECRAVKRVREEMGLANLVVMIPFCRTPEEADQVLEALAENGLQRGENGLEVYVMAEIPANVILARDFAERFDGFSIGSNDLTQLVLGVDRDSTELAHLFDERHPAVRRSIALLIEMAHEKGVKVGLCGQAPSDHPEFARFLVEAGIDTISVNPDSVVQVLNQVAEAESGSRS
jgi:pyruvate,water dikinase